MQSEVLALEEAKIVREYKVSDVVVLFLSGNDWSI